MAPEAKAKADIRVVAQDNEGILANLVAQTAGLAERGVTTSFGLVRDVREELDKRVGQAIDWVEASNQGTIRLVRRATEQTSRLGGEAVDAVENVTLSIVRSLRGAGEALTELTSRASSGLLKRDERPRAA